MYNLLKYKIQNFFVTFEILLGYNAILVLFVNLCNATFITLAMPMATIFFFFLVKNTKVRICHIIFLA